MVSIASYTSGSATTSHINKNSKAQESSLGRIASGKQINKASDNASGLAIATQLLSDVSTLKQASTNLVQSNAVLQTADGALEQAGNILGRMKELATQANSGSLDANSRGAINQEYQSLATELNGLSSSTSFNGTKLVDGSYNQDFQTGKAATDTLNVDLSSVDVSVSGLGLTPANGANANALSTPASAQATSTELDTAIDNISSARAQVGSLLSRGALKSDVVDTEINSTIEAESSISDADIGRESTALSNSKLLMESSLAMASQANRMKSSLLKLVR